MGTCRMHEHSPWIERPTTAAGHVAAAQICTKFSRDTLSQKVETLPHSRSCDCSMPADYDANLNCPIFMRMPGLMMHGCVIHSNAYLNVVGLFFSTLKWATHAGP